MTKPTILYCVGATKAGTSWLYRYLHDHPECQMPAVKEAHYWDTFEAEQRDKQVEAYSGRLADMRELRAQAVAAGRAWQVENVDRRVAGMTGLLDALSQDRTSDDAYRNWLLTDAEDKRVVADMTPSYATLPDDTLTRMINLSPDAKVIYLIRDPLDRMWSHIRMQARRYRQEHEVYEKKANNILRRVVRKNMETHIMARGDYPATIEKLRRVVPEGRLLIQFAEDLFSGQGIDQLCDFLGISPLAPKDDKPVHAGQDVQMMDNLRPHAQAFVQQHYEWVAQHVGPLPQRWQDNLARAKA